MIKPKSKNPITLKESLVILSASCASFMAPLDIYIVAIAAPSIARYFEISLNSVSLIMIVYTLVLTATIIFFGKLGDALGLKKIFILGYAIFTAASLMCAISPTFYFLIFSRALQAIGGAMLYAMGLAIVPTYGAPEHKGFAYGISGMFASLGMLVGAPLGGFLVEFLSWHWIFLINIPMGIFAIFISFYALRKKVPKKVSLDFLGFILSSITILLLFISLSLGQNIGWLSYQFLICVLSAFIFFGLFIFQESRAKEPLVALKLFKNPVFCVSLLTIFLIYLPFSGFNFLFPFFLEDLKGFSTNMAGVLLMFFGLTYLIFSPFLGKLSDKISPIIFSIFGTIVISLSFLIFSFFIPNSNIFTIILFLIFFGFGFACFLTPIFNVVMSNVLPSYEGTGSALLRTASSFGLAIGLSFFQTIFCLLIPLKFSFSHTSKLSFALQHYMQHAFQTVFITSAIIALISFFLLLIVKLTKKETKKNSLILKNKEKS
ncbi:MAG: MFS transporter [Candidatus Margulisiibacteriota bacterium]